MTILKKAFTTDDFSIQLEDWREDWDGYNLDPVIIAAYPKGKWRCRFRAECDFKTLEEAKRAFEDLHEGNATVFDFDFTVMIPGGRRIPIKEKIERENAML